MPTYHSRRPAPTGATGSWRDARRAPAGEVEQAADREQPVWTVALLAMGGTLVPAVVTAWRPLAAGRWAAHVHWGPPPTSEWIIYTPRTLVAATVTPRTDRPEAGPC
ncbi:hypothetical protein OG618_36930 (plasmid) [Kitasatospora sp. NBC_01246]|uniref:hypothetical protein n=1 Tax=Kitasatospora sp. NBC_01246 TaxID=2903570 RepID=UPI002E353CCA|nr:hypothetical protein [Kitasatospora sp. NBC_01246]